MATRSDLDVKALRKAKGWTQVQAAQKLRVSQTYLSLLESGARGVPAALVRRVQRAFAAPMSCLPLPVSLDAWGAVDAQMLARRLAALRYPGLVYLQTKGVGAENPAAVLLWALKADDLEPRLVEALPWLLLHFDGLAVAWLVREAKLNNLQNRLGFVVALAKELARADGSPYGTAMQRLDALLGVLEPSRLVREDTLCEGAMSGRMHLAVTRTRSTLAAHWNLVTGWKVEHFAYEF